MPSLARATRTGSCQTQTEIPSAEICSPLRDSPRTGAGAAAALWPLFSALGPDAETLARRRQFALTQLDPDGQALIDIGGKPVLVFKRTEEQLSQLRKIVTKTTAAATWRDSWSRSVKPEIMVCIASCPHDQCRVSMSLGYEGAALSCPCCASTFDLAGRRQRGPAPTDLPLPFYRYISSGEIEFEELQPL